METVLIVGSTGHIGVAAAQAALRSKLNVLAIVRNQTSAEKLTKFLGSSDGVTFVEADITSDTGVKGVVDQVRAGKLPAFQHVYTCAGGEYSETPLKDLSNEAFRSTMKNNFESNFYAYRDTIHYLLEQKNPNSTYTICTGAQGDFATRAGPAMTQGPLYSMATAASRENEHTNVRFNEVYLATRVETDESAIKNGVMKASDFSSVYEEILARPEIRGARVSVYGHEDLKNLKFKSKF